MGELSQAMAEVKIFDTHEHISPPEIASGYDLFDLIVNSYMGADVVSANVLPELPGPSASLSEKWRAYQTFLPVVENTSYSRSLFAALSDLYGVDAPPRDERSFVELSEKIADASRSPNRLENVLGKAGIGLAILDRFWNVGNTEIDTRLFRLALRVDPLLCLHAPDHDGNDAAAMAAKRGMAVETFEEYVKFVDALCEGNVNAGAVCFKVASAYERTLAFDKVEQADAAKIYEKPPGKATPAESLAFGNYVLHYIVRKAADYRLPVQIHTGLQHGGGNLLSNSNPLLLAPLFLEYPEARFDVFHGGYPFYEEAGCMVKNFSNVHMDMCWLPLISFRAATRALHTWLDLIPANKLHWGGDAFTPEEAYGAAKQARMVVTQVLEERVQARELSDEAAVRIGKMILRENSEEFFGERIGG
jgi:hypothetical protein